MKYKIGDIVGIWTVLDYTKSKNGRRYVARCNRCGFVNDHITNKSLEMVPKRCNHMRNEWFSQRLARCYHDMIKRCYNPKAMGYEHYGARGIEVCKEWREDKLAFNNWAVSNGYRDGLTIDRIDNDKGYYPENCRWVTKHFNFTHKRCNKHLTYKGETMTPFEWSQKLGLSKHAFYDKCLVQPIEEVEDYLAAVIEGRAIYIPEVKEKREITIKGETHTIKEWANKIGWTKKQLSDHFTQVGKKKCKETIKRYLSENKGKLVVYFGNG